MCRNSVVFNSAFLSSRCLVLHIISRICFTSCTILITCQFVAVKPLLSRLLQKPGRSLKRIIAGKYANYARDNTFIWQLVSSVRAHTGILYKISSLLKRFLDMLKNDDHNNHNKIRYRAQRTKRKRRNRSPRVMTFFPIISCFCITTVERRRKIVITVKYSKKTTPGSEIPFFFLVLFYLLHSTALC